MTDLQPGPRGIVAWVEMRNEIATLCMAAGGQRLLERSLARADTSNYGYEGCDARYLAWHGERLVVVTTENGLSYLRTMESDGSDERDLPLTHAWIIGGDLILWVSDDPGLLSAAALPSLDPCTPLPFRGATLPNYIRLDVSEAGRCRVSDSTGDIDTLALPAATHCEGQICVDDLIDRLGAHSESARLVLESAGYPFLRGAAWRKPWEPSPVWIAAYWHRYLASARRTAEAKELLQSLDALAAPLGEREPERGWDARWSAREGHIELAARYIRRQARRLAEVCRSGALPHGWWCLLFDPAPRSRIAGSRVDVRAYPPTLRRVFEELVATKPERLAERR